MTSYYIDTDIPCWCAKAASFPDGVLAAHQEVHALFTFDGQRRFFGISRPQGNGRISYWAAAEIMAGDDHIPEHFEQFIIGAGKYWGRDITSFRKDIPAVGNTFRELLQHPQLDPDGYCLEWYYNMNDVRCMVPLIQADEKVNWKR